MSLIDAFRALPEDEQELRARTARGERAKALLDNELFKGALQACRDQIVKNLVSCKPGDLEGLREQRLLYEGLEMVASAIAQHVRAGQLAENALMGIEKRKLFGRK